MMRPSIALLAVALLGCTDTAEVARPVTGGAYSSASPSPRLGYDASGEPVAVELNAVVVHGSSALPRLPAADSAAMVIRTATASVEVDSLEPAVAALRGLAARAGGYVANTSIQTGSGQLRSATLVLKIPAMRFDDALSGLAPIGKVEAVEVSTQDVGEEYVDMTARTDNARRLERRLIELLANRAGKLKDVLDVEQALARVREDIERYEGRLRYLRAHVATSTLSVRVHEPLPLVGTAGTSVMGEAFKQAWRNFVALLAFGVQALGVVIPLGVLGSLGWIAARRYRRAFSQRAA